MARAAVLGRLTWRVAAEHGYEAQRSYSIASAPDGTRVELTVERLDDGEVSPYLTHELRPGDRIELRGPSAAISSGSLRERRRDAAP